LDEKGMTLLLKIFNKIYIGIYPDQWLSSTFIKKEQREEMQIID